MSEGRPAAEARRASSCGRAVRGGATGIGRRPRGERPRLGELPVLRADERFVERLAAALAAQLAELLEGAGGEEDEGYLDAEAAARYIGATRKRIHDLTSDGRLVPDGRDGRRPLYRRRSLDEYVGRAVGMR